MAISDAEIDEMAHPRRRATVQRKCPPARPKQTSPCFRREPPIDLERPGGGSRKYDVLALAPWLARSSRKSPSACLHRPFGRGKPRRYQADRWRLSELRIHYGPGYRIYLMQQDNRLVILLCGGDKGTQSRDIDAAKRIAADWLKANP